jgi:CubicO group peptidase (beta-lactamase class C family)
MPATPIDDLLAYQLAARHYPGAIVHVERAGQVLAHRAVGRMRPDADAPMHDEALFKIASLTKAVVSVAALIFVQERRLGLDAPITEYLPEMAELRMLSGDRPARAPTVRDLLRHTSGFGYVGEVREAAVRARVAESDLDTRVPHIDPQTFIAELARLPLAFEPGSRFRYSPSTDVVGVILERIAGMPLAEVLRRKIFESLGMTQTGFEVDPTGESLLTAAYPEDTAWYAVERRFGRRTAGKPWMDGGGGGLVSTIADYARFARMLADGGVAGGERILGTELFAEMARDQLPAGLDGPANFTGPGFGFGLALAVRLDWGPAAMPCQAGELAWSGVTGTALFVHPKERWFALAFSCNTSSRMMARMEFRRALARS